MKKLMIAIACMYSFGALAKIGPAGCGLGHQFFGGEESQVLASTTNSSSYTQLFGISSGTSNCEGPSGVAKLESFIEGNRVAVETEAARGSGETLESLAQILKCPSSEKVGAALRSSHQEIFSSSSSLDVANKMKKTLKDNKVLCLSLG